MSQDLLVERRSEQGSRQVQKLRNRGRIPAVVYHEGKTGENISIEERVFSRMLHEGERVVQLKGFDREIQALIKAIQYDSLGEKILHVDFHELKAGQKVNVRVSFKFTGTAKGIVDGGMVNPKMHEIEVTCLPTEIPEHLLVDVSALALGDAIHVRDLKLPEGISTSEHGELVVVSCDLPRKEEVAAAPVEGLPTEPEVLTAKKPEEGEAVEAVEAKGKEKGKDAKEKEKEKK